MDNWAGYGYNNCLNCVHAKGIYVATNEIYSTQSDIDDNISIGHIIEDKVYRDKIYTRADIVNGIKMCRCNKSEKFESIVNKYTPACNLYELAYRQETGIAQFNGIQEVKQISTRNNGIVSQYNHRLKVDMIPKYGKKYKVPNLVSSSQWDVIRDRVYIKNRGRCFCCNKQLNGSYKAHEVWDYDNNNAIIRLVDIVPLCKECHNAVHFYFGSSFKDLTERLERLKNINGWSYVSLGNNVEKIINRGYERDSIKGWRLDLRYLYSIDTRSIRGGLAVYICRRCGDILKFKGDIIDCDGRVIPTYICQMCRLEEKMLCEICGGELTLKADRKTGHLFYGCVRCYQKNIDYSRNYPTHNDAYGDLRNLNKDLLDSLDKHKPYVNKNVLEIIVSRLKNKKVKNGNWGGKIAGH